MIKSGEKADCADVAIAALIRVASQEGLPLRLRYYADGKWKHFDSRDDAYSSPEQYEAEMRNNLGAQNIFDNTRAVKNYEQVEAGDIFLYDLRFHRKRNREAGQPPPEYTGHTMPVLGVGREPGKEAEYTVAEGHTSAQRGEGTRIDARTYTESAIKSKFPNRYADDTGPRGLRAGENESYRLLEEGARSWRFEDFN